MARILIVEDEGQARAPSPKSILKAAKYGTLSASTVTEAMVFADSKGRIDLLFTDRGLGARPDGGFRSCGEIARARHGLRVL